MGQQHALQISLRIDADAGRLKHRHLPTYCGDKLQGDQVKQVLISPPCFRSISSDEQIQQVSSTRVLIRCIVFTEGFRRPRCRRLFVGINAVCFSSEAIHFFLILQVATPSVACAQRCSKTTFWYVSLLLFDVNLPLDCQSNVYAFAESSFGCNTVVRKLPNGCVNNLMFKATCMRIFLNPYKLYSYVYHIHILYFLLAFNEHVYT